MNVGSTIAQSILLTFFWMIFAYAGRTFSKNEPPQAIIFPAEFVKIEPDEEIKELPESMVASGLSTLSGLATFSIGLKLFGHWGYASATLALRPIIVAYYFRYVANSPPAPKMPSS
tara:strand:+ start:486 stop:833 length:348 start_codon:yes stop_codon:yes gene_type:complete